MESSEENPSSECNVAKCAYFDIDCCPSGQTCKSGQCIIEDPCYGKSCEYGCTAGVCNECNSGADCPLVKAYCLTNTVVANQGMQLCASLGSGPKRCIENYQEVDCTIFPRSTGCTRGVCQCSPGFKWTTYAIIPLGCCSNNVYLPCGCGGEIRCDGSCSKEFCSSGQRCNNGVCEGASSCQNECSSGQRICDGNAVKICQRANCGELGGFYMMTIIPCSAGETCSNGQCVSSTSSTSKSRWSRSSSISSTSTSTRTSANTINDASVTFIPSYETIASSYTSASSRASSGTRTSARASAATNINSNSNAKSQPATSSSARVTRINTRS